MPASPERVRTALLRVTTAAKRELRSAAAAATQEPEPWRATLFAVAPLVVDEYAPAASTLGMDWFEEVRTEANPRGRYQPTPRLNVTDDDVAAMVARTTVDLRDQQRLAEIEFEALAQQMLAQVEGELQKQVAGGFWDTVVENSYEDPQATGWQRYARSGACKFCLMLAARGAVYSDTTATFAAHTNCHCVAGPTYDLNAPRASAIQYLASSKRPRSKQAQADRNARLRTYLNDNYPDAAG